MHGAGEAQWWERSPPTMQCVRGSIPGPGVTCGLSLLLVLAFAPRVFSRFSGFPPSSKTNISKFQFDREFEGHGFVSRRLLCATPIKQSQFIYLFIQFITAESRNLTLAYRATNESLAIHAFHFLIRWVASYVSYWLKKCISFSLQIFLCVFSNKIEQAFNTLFDGFKEELQPLQELRILFWSTE